MTGAGVAVAEVVGGADVVVDTGGGVDDIFGAAIDVVVDVVETAAGAVDCEVPQVHPATRVRIARVASIITSSFFIFVLLIFLKTHDISVHIFAFIPLPPCPLLSMFSDNTEISWRPRLDSCKSSP
jgi:hypothetical protein